MAVAFPPETRSLSHAVASLGLPGLKQLFDISLFGLQQHCTFTRSPDGSEAEPRKHVIVSAHRLPAPYGRHHPHRSDPFQTRNWFFSYL